MINLRIKELLSKNQTNKLIELENNNEIKK